MINSRYVINCERELMYTISKFKKCRFHFTFLRKETWSIKWLSDLSIRYGWSPDVVKIGSYIDIINLSVGVVSVTARWLDVMNPS